MKKGIVVVKNLDVQQRENKCTISCTYIGSIEVETKLWFEIESTQPYSPTVPGDAFVSPVLARVLEEESDVRFEITVSTSVSFNANEIAYLLGIVFGKKSLPNIEFTDVQIPKESNSGVAIGFSSGVDSWFSLKKLLLEQNDKSHRLTHLATYDVGANATQTKTDQVFQNTKRVAEEFALEFVGIRSNLNEFVKQPFQQTHTVRNAAATLLLAPICSRFFYSSSTHIENTGVKQAHDMCFVEPVLLPLLSNDAISLRLLGSTYKRSEKTKEILNIPRIGERLDVCTNHRHKKKKINCGACWKCLRTELTLEAFGALSDFEATFDTEAYKKRRREFLRKASTRGSQGEKDAFEVARAAGIVGPIGIYKVEWIFMRIYQKMKSAFIGKERKI